MGKRILLVGLAVLVLFVSASATAAEDQKLDLDGLIQEALASNPEIAAVKERQVVFSERVPQAGALEDPMLGLGIVNLPTNFSFREEDMTMKEVSISQALPFPGKRSLMREAAEKEAEAVSKEVQEKANDIVREVKNTYWDLSHNYRTSAVTQRNKGILESLAKIAESRYSVGEGIQQDVLKAQVEISQDGGRTDHAGAAEGGARGQTLQPPQSARGVRPRRTRGAGVPEIPDLAPGASTTGPGLQSCAGEDEEHDRGQGERARPGKARSITRISGSVSPMGSGTTGGIRRALRCTEGTCSPGWWR